MKSKHSKMNIILLSFVLPLALLSLCIHKSSYARENISFDAHVHGVSEMTVAIDKHALEIEIKSPAVNLVGFEHQAISKEDIARMKATDILLNKHSALFSFSGGNCELVNQSTNLPSYQRPTHQVPTDQQATNSASSITDIDVDVDVDTDSETDHHTNHHNEKEHKHKDEHEDEHVKAQPANTNHSEIIANYVYHCEKVSNLSAITVTLFDYFPNIEKIQTMWISENQQGAVMLNTRSRILNVK